MRLAAFLLSILLAVPAVAGNALDFAGSADYFTGTASAGYDGDDFMFACLAYPDSPASTVLVIIGAYDSTASNTTIAEMRTIVVVGNRQDAYNHEDSVSGSGDPSNIYTDPQDWIYYKLENDDVSSRYMQSSDWDSDNPDQRNNSNSTTLSSFGTADTISIGRASTSSPYGYFDGRISWCAAWSEGVNGGDGPLYLPVRTAIQFGMNPAMAGIEKLTSFWMFWEDASTIQDLGSDGIDLSVGGNPSLDESMPKPMFWARGAR